MKKWEILLIPLVILVVLFPFSTRAFANKDLFIKQCAVCHTIGKGRLVGPDLLGVQKKRTQAWLLSFMKSPQKMIEKGDSIALKLKAEYGLVMPELHLSEEEIRSLLDYIVEEENQIKGDKQIQAARHYNEHVGAKSKQPIAFSHEIHAGAYQIPCLYCHTGARKSRHAGVPSANVCLNCHSQVRVDSPEIQKIHSAVKENKPIVWLKRHNLPDHAYFNHSQHVNAGVECQTCHGPVQNQIQPKPIQITMGWCIQCHRETNKGLTGMDHVKAQTKLDCVRCHH